MRNFFLNFRQILQTIEHSKIYAFILGLWADDESLRIFLRIFLVTIIFPVSGNGNAAPPMYNGHRRAVTYM